MLGTKLRSGPHAGGSDVIISDFTTYTEIDPTNVLTVTPSRVTASNMRRDADVYVYLDMGINGISGDFAYTFDFEAITIHSYGFAGLLSLSNDLGDLSSQDYRINVSLYGNELRLNEKNGASNVDEAHPVSAGSLYYLKFWRDTSTGPNGTVYLGIASSPADRSSGAWDSLLSIALSADHDLRYLYVMCAFNSGSSTSVFQVNAYVENLVEG